MERAPTGKLATNALGAVQIASLVAIAGCVYAMFGRLGYACELEWMTGSVYDHVERIREGKSLYTAPSMEWTPFMYPPLYYELVANLAGFLPLNLAGRGVSIVATTAQGVCVWRLATKQGASRAWALIGLGVFAAAFADTSFWYDLERVDSLFMALTATAVVVLVERRDSVAAVLAGILLGLAFFAKQPAAAFIAGIAFALAITGQVKRAAAFALPAAIVIVVGVLRLQATSGGWFAYYVLKMPGAHGVVPSLFKVLFLEDVPKAFALVAAATFIVVVWLRRVRKRDGADGAVFAGALAAGALAAGSSRVHLGGWDNVLMFFTTFACPAIAIAGQTLWNRWADAKAVFLGPVVAAFQMVIWLYDPTSAIPSRTMITEARAFEVRVKELEKEGEVLVTGRGHVTTPRHAHHAAIIDVFRTEKRIPDEIAAPLREARYAVIVIDSFNDFMLDFLPSLKGELFNIVFARYYVAERLPFGMPDAWVGFHTHPRYVLRRRKERLDEKAVELVRCRAKAERVLVESRERIQRSGGTVKADVDIETPAKASCDAALVNATSPEHWVGDDPLPP